MAHDAKVFVRRTGLLLILALAGCAPEASRPPQTVADPNLRITLAVQPASPRQLDPARLTVTLRDVQGRPVSGALVTAALTMPGMDMGPNTVPLASQAPGTYTGLGRFTMPGGWQAMVSAAHGGDRAAQSFPVSVR